MSHSSVELHDHSAAFGSGSLCMLTVYERHLRRPTAVCFWTRTMQSISCSSTPTRTLLHMSKYKLAPTAHWTASAFQLSCFRFLAPLTQVHGTLGVFLESHSSIEPTHANTLRCVPPRIIKHQHHTPSSDTQRRVSQILRDAPPQLVMCGGV